MAVRIETNYYLRNVSKDRLPPSPPLHLLHGLNDGLLSSLPLPFLRCLNGGLHPSPPLPFLHGLKDGLPPSPRLPFSRSRLDDRMLPSSWLTLLRLVGGSYSASP